VARIQVRRLPGESLEEQAREGRYAAFEGADASTIALAHHAEDQAETVLLQMFRGAGPKGLAGMAESMPARPGKVIWRPLLETPRAEILQFGLEHKIAWIEDESNLDQGFRRNYVRHRVWPAIADGFPGAAGSFARVARLQADSASLLAELADLDLANVEMAGGLDCEKLKLLSQGRQANLLRRWISRTGARAPSEARLGALLTALCDSTNDSRLTWKHENQHVYRRRNRLVIEAV
jgi:tRNA(Ile)-lysidine synthase